MYLLKMSKITLYILALLAVALVGAFAFFAMVDSEIQQEDLVIDVPSERLG